MFVLGHLGFTLIGARLLAPALRRGASFPVGFLLVGALLPDLVDKPLGHVILPWDNGRLWAHTLLFTVLLAALAWGTASRRLGATSLGVGFHQLLDQIPWQDPGAWLWPLGSFPREVSAGVPDWWAALLTDPYLWTTETIGLLAVASLLVLPMLGWRPAWWRGPASDASAPGPVPVPVRPGAEGETDP
ncbi:hypothetical protein BRD56_02130 [Thermoplasmatales archaeon SW_10_69_26]|nr:MAG: hypothetical protein BRD56_02130 [Thermoplasmatales archaeon SW_10_69_26]